MSNFNIIPETTFIHEGQVWGVLYQIGTGLAFGHGLISLQAMNPRGETREFWFYSSGDVRSFE